MTKSLVIVESPAKARTINRYLGKDSFVVKSSVGHVRDLAKKTTAGKRGKTAGSSNTKAPANKKSKNRAPIYARMGIDPDNNWSASYAIIPEKKKTVSELQSLALDSDKVYLATDRDREGEAIAWHLFELIENHRKRKKGKALSFYRVVFNEITASAIQKAFAHPVSIDQHKVDAQQARRFLDRIVGFMVSPLLWSGIGRGLSAGRVQSVAVRLIVEREREIRAFRKEEFWEVHADMKTGQNQPLRLQVRQKSGKRFRPTTREATEKALRELEVAAYQITRKVEKPTQIKPAAPLITSTLQQAASTRLNLNVSQTMRLAQNLYEAGFITYMRTDSSALSNDAVTACRKHIASAYGEDYLPSKPFTYHASAQSQEAHEAIRPTDVRCFPDSPKMAELPEKARRLYQLIWQFFVACQMQPARFNNTQLAAQGGDYELRASGRILLFDGFLKVLPQGKRERGNDDRLLPVVEQGEKLQLEKLEPSQHFTKPKPRYTEAALVKELEKRQIGRPSTYASIISTIQERGYVSLKNRNLHAEMIAETVTDRLLEFFGDLFNYDFTREMEVKLDHIAEQKQDYKTVLDDFYRKFLTDLTKAEDTEQGMAQNPPIVMSDFPCNQCDRDRNMTIRSGRYGLFLSCEGYQQPKEERCKHSINIKKYEVDNSEAKAPETVQCEHCIVPMSPYRVDDKTLLYICADIQKCKGCRYRIEHGHFPIGGYSGPTQRCHHCDSEMVLKEGRFGRYFACTSPECGTTRKLLANGQLEPARMKPIPLPDVKCKTGDDHFILRESGRGLFIGASTFPRLRETRKPLVSELLSCSKQLEDKFPWFGNIPEKDPDGNPAQILYSIKTSAHYLAGQKGDKASGWYCYHENNRWKDWEKQASKNTGRRRKARPAKK